MANDIFDTLANGKKNWLEGAYTHTQIQQANLPDPAWFVPTLIPNPGLVAITGRPGSFKTFFTQWLALRLSAHLPLFDTWDTEPPFNKSQVPTEPINVCFIEEEMTYGPFRGFISFRSLHLGNNITGVEFFWERAPEHRHFWVQENEVERL